MKLLYGREIAKQILLNLKKEIVKKKIKPILAVVLVGKDPASLVYVRAKEKTCREVGIGFKKYLLTKNIQPGQILQLISNLNQDKTISGIIIQLPLPAHLNTNQIISAISPSKDVDGLHPENLGKLIIGEKTIIPPTPAAILEILSYYKMSLKGKHLVFVGYGKLVGKPLAAMLATAQRDATITICNKDTKNLAFYTKQADVLISATGVPHLIKTNMVKHGAVVIDAGTTVIESRMPNEECRMKNAELSKKNEIHNSSFIIHNSRVVGDVDFAKVKKIAGAITPPVGGLGPVTVAKLLENVIKLYDQSSC